jgi:hypothetical protein
VLAKLVKHFRRLFVIFIRKLLLDYLGFQGLFVLENFTVDATLLKNHLIQGEGARLVSENKFNLAHFLNEVGIPTGRETEFGIVD